MSTDQRGPGSDRVVGSAVDMGAVETQLIREPGTLAFATATYETNEQAGTVRVTVSRTGGGDGAVSIDYGTVADTAHAGTDYTAAAGTLSWADGETGDKAFDVPVFDDAMNEGTELFGLTLTNPVGSPVLGLTGATVSIARSDPQGAGVYHDQDGDKYTIKLAGKVGSLAYYRSDPDGDGNGPIERIELTGTLPDPLLPKASLVIAAPGPRRRPTAGPSGSGPSPGPGRRASSPPGPTWTWKGSTSPATFGRSGSGTLRTSGRADARHTESPAEDLDQCPGDRRRDGDRHRLGSAPWWRHRSAPDW